MSANIRQLVRYFDKSGMMIESYRVVYDRCVYSSGCNSKLYKIRGGMCSKHLDFMLNAKFSFVVRSFSGRKIACIYSDFPISDIN